MPKQDLSARLLPRFLQLISAVRAYPELSEEEISSRVDPMESGIRDRDWYPEPFPRDGTFLLPDEWAVLVSIAEEVEGLAPGRTSLGHRLWQLQGCLQLAVKRDVGEELFDVLVGNLRRFDEEWKIVVPIDNLELEVPLLEVGPVSFHPKADDEFNRWRAHTIRERLKDALPGDDPAKYPEWLDTLGANVRSCAKVTARGDSLLAAKRALGMISEAIDVLRVFLAKSEATRPWGGMNFGPMGRGAVMTIEYGQRMLSKDGTPVERVNELLSRSETSYVGTAARFITVVDDRQMAFVNARGLRLFGQILAKPEDTRTDLEERLVRSAAWYSQGVSSGDNTDRFLKYVIGLDALLGGKGEDGAMQVAERLAFLLSRETDGRRAVKKRAKGYFNRRGPVAHGKRGQVPADVLSSLESDVSLAIQQFAIDHLHRGTFSAFLDWIEEQKFSTAPTD